MNFQKFPQISEDFDEFREIPINFHQNQNENDQFQKKIAKFRNFKLSTKTRT